MDRRSFLAGTATAATLPMASATAGARSTADIAGAPTKVRYFHYRDVTLRRSRFLNQVRAARETYYAIPDDDILNGFRRNAGLPAPGNGLKGWARTSSGSTFDQWLSGMARLSRALGDAAMRDKAVGLAIEWEETAARSHQAGGDDWSTYRWEKTFQGLLDLVLYADEPRFVDTMVRMTRWASADFDRTRAPATATAPRVRSNGTRWPGTRCARISSPAIAPSSISRNCGNVTSSGARSPPPAGRRERATATATATSTR